MAVTFYAPSIQARGFDAAAEPTNSGETYTSSGGETTGVLYDLVDNRRTNVCTWDTSGQSVTTTVRIDQTNSLTATAAIIDNHNLKTAEADVDIEQGGANVTINSSYYGTLGTEMTADSTAGTPDGDGVSLFEFDSVADTQWEFELNYSVGIGNFDADITIGEIFLSAPLDMGHNPELQPTFGYSMPGASFRESEGGQRYGFSTHNNDRKSWRLMWKFLTTSKKELLEDVYKFCRGSKFPFYIDLGPLYGETNPRLYYVRFMRELSFVGLTKDVWQVTVDIEEEI